MNTKNVNQEDVLQANRYVHASLASSGEYNKSPHFLLENQTRVKNELVKLKNSLPLSAKDTKLLDIGCGTGFILHLAASLFDSLYGIDITPEMMEQVDVSLGDIQLTNCNAESLPFEDNYFDMATAYSFLDHVLDYRLVLEEAFRVLKPSGIFYADLNPNRAFNEMLDQFSEVSSEALPKIVNKEILGGLNNGEYYQKEFGLDKDIFVKAEPMKSYSKGFSVNEVEACAKEIGFSKVIITYQWYLGEAGVRHGQSLEKAQVVNDYLKSLLPVTSSFYKYLKFVFVK
ncbi:MAG: 2-methoxy-6-polyprenyl-1,4-benzoquinol methylase, mitochondrial [Chlamydiae bacterium]|nr:2-methoxy-6-polyprenyl-1,4-benzoquinol methylase, mitochondrial [Chlamydiota bacterium]